MDQILLQLDGDVFRAEPFDILAQVASASVMRLGIDQPGELPVAAAGEQDEAGGVAGQQVRIEPGREGGIAVVIVGVIV